MTIATVGLIVEVTDGDTLGYRGNLFYGLAKNAVIRLAYAMAADPDVGARSGGLLDLFVVRTRLHQVKAIPRRPTRRSGCGPISSAIADRRVGRWELTPCCRHADPPLSRITASRSRAQKADHP